MVQNILRNIQALPRAAKFWIMQCLDVIAIALAILISLTINQHSFDLAILAIVPLAVALLNGFGTYKSVASHIGKRTVLKLLLTLALSSAIFQLLVNYLPTTLTYALLTLSMAGGWRYARTLLNTGDGKSYSQAQQHIAIYGAGEAGLQLAAYLKHARSFHPVCFVDDNKALQGRETMDLPIIAPEKLTQEIQSKKIEKIILAIPSASRSTRNGILEKLENLNTPIQTMPGLDEIITGKANITELRDIDPLDLLGRDPVPADATLLGKCITDKNILVTGAGGSIGSELCRQIIALKPAKLVLFEASEYALYTISSELEALANETKIISVLGSVQNIEAVEDVCKNHKIQTIYHAAAYKHVPIVEKNIAAAINNNTIGTINTALASQKNKVETFVLISTDKAVRPTSAMGATKRLAEKAIQIISEQKQNKTTFCFVRFGNVLASSGSVIPLFRKQIAAGGPVTVTHPEMTRFFMSIPEASQLVIQAGAMANAGDGFTLDMGQSVKIVDMAKRLIKLSGLTPKTDSAPNGDIDIIYTGLRPGEKLYEELFIDEDAAEHTDHPRIRREKEAVNITSLKDFQKDISNALSIASPDKLRKALFKLAE